MRHGANEDRSANPAKIPLPDDSTRSETREETREWTLARRIRPEKSRIGGLRDRPRGHPTVPDPLPRKEVREGAMREGAAENPGARSCSFSKR